MSRSLDQTLLSLMPTHGSALPPSLVTLASSLLAQSRHRASTLRAEEEIARLYACCHIACDRLKISLNLPPIEARPPIPPRIYKRLYAHLEHILPNNTQPRTPGKNGTPRSRLRETPGTGRSLGSNATPSRTPRVLSNSNTPTKSTGRAVPLTGSRTGLHPWIQPTIRFMCKETGYARYGPTILAGAESIIAPGGRRTKDEWVQRNLAPLCGALYFFVAQQVQKLEFGQEIDRDTYLPARKEILGLLTRAREQPVGRRVPEDEAWEGWQAPRAKDIDVATTEVTQRGWLDDDWFRGIADILAAADVDNESANKAFEQGAPDQPALRRADTMFQDRYNFLADEKRRHYQVWKTGIMRQIEAAEREQREVAGKESGQGAMEVDS